MPASIRNNIPLDFGTLEYGLTWDLLQLSHYSDKDKARNAATTTIDFFKHESCGKCTCRAGTSKASELMREEHWNINLLKDLESKAMANASIWSRTSSI